MTTYFRLPSSNTSWESLRFWSILLLICGVGIIVNISPAECTNTDRGSSLSCYCEDPSKPTEDTCMCLSGLIRGELCLHTHISDNGTPQNYSTDHNLTPFCECCVTMFLPMCDFRTGCINKPSVHTAPPDIFQLPKKFSKEKKNYSELKSPTSSHGKEDNIKDTDFDIILIALCVLLGLYVVYGAVYIVRRRRQRKEAQTRDLMKTHILEQEEFSPEKNRREEGV